MMRAVRLGGRRGVLCALLCGLVVVAACAGGPSSRPSTEQSAGDLEQAIDERLDSRAVDRVRAVVVVHDGETVLADYRGTTPEGTWDTESVTKSVLSILVGRAVDDGLLALDQTLAELLPEHVGSMARWQRAVTLRELLTHTGGFSGEDWLTLRLMDDPKLTDLMLGRAERQARGEFRYSNEGSQVIATILRAAVGGSVLEYARAVLFDPLGIDTTPALEGPIPAEVTPAYTEDYLQAGFAWPVDSAGTHLGWGLLKLAPADLAKIGALMLDGGTWDGARVVSEAWVTEATRSHVSTDSDPRNGGAGLGYGYHWWVTTAGDEAAYLAWGFGGQLVEVVPRLRLVVVVVRELDYEDPSVDGIHPDVLTDMVADLIVPRFR